MRREVTGIGVPLQTVTEHPKNGTVSVAAVREKKAYVLEFAPELWDLAETVMAESVELGPYSEP